MTLQIALIGKDSFVFASDRLAYYEPDPNSSYATYETKLAISEDGQLVCGLAGDKNAIKRLSELVRVTIPPPEMSDISIKDYFSQQVTRLKIRVGPASPKTSLLYAFKHGNGFKVVRVRINQTGASCDLLSDTFAVAGHEANPALYFIRRVLDRIRQLPTSTLINLASFVITHAARFQSGYIGGLDIVIFEKGRAQFFPRESVNTYAGMEPFYSDKAIEWILLSSASQTAGQEP